MIESIKELLGLIAQYGLPIVLTIYFVLRMDTQISKFITMLGAFITWMQQKWDEHVDQIKEVRVKQDALLQLVAEQTTKLRILEVRLEK